MQQQPMNNTQMQQPQQTMQNNMGNGGNMQMQQPQTMEDNPMNNMPQEENNSMDNAPQMEEGGEVVNEPQDDGRLILNWGLVFTFFK